MDACLNPQSKQNDRTAKFRGLSLFTVGLLVGILFYMGWGISEVVQGLEIRLTWTIIGVGLGVGWLLAKYSRRTLISIAFSLFGGALFSSLTIGRLWDDLWRSASNAVIWMGTAADSLTRTLRGEPTLPSFGQLFIIIHTFTESVFFMLQRMALWVWRFPRMNSDLIASLLIWGVVVWLTTLWAAWCVVRRKHPLEAVLPAILLTAVARMYANASSSLLLLMLGAAVIMVVLAGQARRESDWELHGFGHSELIRKHVIQAALMLSTVLVFTAWGITSIDLEKFKELWEELTNKQYYYSSGDIGSSLGIEQDKKRAMLVDEFSRLSRGNLPNSHLIGSSPDLAEELVMVVQVEEVDPLAGDVMEVDKTVQTYYFRSLTFDQYTPRGWNANSTKIYVYQGGQEAISSYSNHQRLVKQQIIFQEKIEGAKKVYAIGEIAVVDRPYNVSWREGDGLGDYKDMFGATLDANSYEVFSLIPVFSEEDLRTASVDYPDWVVSRYLQLPKTLPSRVVDLAFEITQNELNNYDKAVAIERFLRTFPYTLDLPDRPQKVDLVDYFLFDVKTGYCDYYASSMVVLARAVGIPARLAVGYVGSTFDPEIDSYLVTADQSHSWVEIYFTGYGWVTFEPTAGRSAVEREAPAISVLDLENELAPEEDINQFPDVRLVLLWLAGVVCLIFLGGWIWLQVQIIMLRRLPVKKAFRVIYRHLLWLGRWLDVAQSAWLTPQEFSDLVKARLADLIYEYPRLKFLSEAAQDLDALMGLINKAAFSPIHPNRGELTQAVDYWVAIRRYLGFVIIWKYFVQRLPLRRKRSERRMVV